jgi:Na+-transporting NADH:ubiquinone oxidoreductase subunit C
MRENPGKTLLVAAAVATFCSLFVSAAVHYLRPIQATYQSIDRSRAVLEAAGIEVDGEAADSEIVRLFRSLDARVVKLDDGSVVDGIDAHNFDHWSEAEKGDEAAAQPKLAPVYIVTESGELSRIVLPVSGPGMWSTIYAYVALEPDLRTIAAFVVYGHGETPGIGDKIEDSDWLKRWRGKTLINADNEAVFRVSKDASDDTSVDAISGATKTAVATGDLVRNWMGDSGFGPFLQRIREEGV